MGTGHCAPYLKIEYNEKTRKSEKKRLIKRNGKKIHSQFCIILQKFSKNRFIATKVDCKICQNMV